MVKNLPADARDAGSIPGSGRSPGGGNGNPLQYSYLGNLTDRGAWQATVHGVTELDTSEHTCTCTHIYVCMYTKAQRCKRIVQCHKKLIKEP